MATLSNAKQKPIGEMILARIWEIWNWRVALPAAAAAALLVAGWLVIGPRAKVPAPARLAFRAVATPAVKTDLEPTFSNYEMAVHQSMDKLDELLSEQGNRNPQPSPIYTATRLPSSNAAD
jgi:hypothetical protein